MKNHPQAVQAEASKPVMVWLNYMGLLLLIGSAVFMFGNTSALIVFAATIISGISAFVLFQIYPNIYVVGIPQLIFWSPPLIYIFATEFAGGAADFSRPFIIWLTIASLTILVSLVFDVRDLYLVATRGRGKAKARKLKSWPVLSVWRVKTAPTLTLRTVACGSNASPVGSRSTTKT